MKLVIIITAVVAVIAVVAAVLFWRIRKRRKSRFISLVALLREPAWFDSAVLATTAAKAWNADLGDGTTEGEDGFAVSGDVINMIMYRGQMTLVHSFARPYLDDPAREAESIDDLRIRKLFKEHAAWFSCDALGVDGSTTQDEITDRYRLLAKLIGELLDENCLLLYVPEHNQAYAINDETQKALQSDDPLAALRATASLPVIWVSDDDPQMKAAMEKARGELPRFLTAFEEKTGTNFSIKAPISHEDNTEFIWIELTAVEGDRAYGLLGNEPANLGSLKLGSKVSIPFTDLNDWCYLDENGQFQGGFTIAAVGAAARRKQ
jgi:uncharacterized protein YegJ (DUF2314 family)